ncbi:hypothetical protein PRUB_a4017 [Pseudoalteromonas rubra]|uniref:Uncharacterized protein n=1 Tax=Pseudoalteromonas rubra TaxID=43658 RepID=A0A8T0C8T5_9GAMM|nr:hypothetical protein PRUB_a4017 [Pseudoalteromonas rubra]
MLSIELFIGVQGGNCYHWPGLSEGAIQCRLYKLNFFWNE